MTRGLFASAAVIAIVAVWPREAAAQTSPAAANPPPAATQSGGSGLAEVTVTAQRRTENVQKSSLDIAVLGGKDLVRKGVVSAADITNTNPVVQIAQEGTFTQTNIRGSGDTALNSLAQTAISYSVDGVVNGQAVGISQNFYDLARVELLYGPQGTLYGRNATGGAVNLITNRPTQTFGGYITAEYGNYNDKRVTGAVNLPINDTLAIRAAFNFIDRDGYLSDGTDDDVRQSGRLQLYWQPNENFNLRLYGDVSHTGGKGGGVVLFPRQPGTNPWTSAASPINNAFLALETAGLAAPYIYNSSQDLMQYDASAELNIKLGDFATLTILPAYRYLHFGANNNSVSFPTAYDPQITNQGTLEVRLGHESNRLKWVVGGFLYNDNSHFTFGGPIWQGPLKQPTPIQTFDVNPHIDSTNRSYAGFGQATYSVTDNFRLIAGLRGTEDIVSYNGYVRDEATPPDPRSPAPLSGRKTFSALTWRAGWEYDVRPNSMLYFTAAKGYKAGGFWYDFGGDDNSYRPEELTTYDLGIRNRFFDNRLQVNAELFYSQYHDQQLTAVGFTANAGIAYLTRNAGESTPYGASLDVNWKATPDDTISFNVDYTRAVYSKFNIYFPAALIFTLRTGPHCAVSSAPTLNPQGNAVYNVNCAGAPLPRTPEWSGAVNYQHIFHLGDSGDLAFDANVTMATSRYIHSDFYVSEELAAAYAELNGDLTYTPPNGKWSVTVFAKNITNAAIYTGGLENPVTGFIPGTPALVARTIDPPRTYGVRATYNF